ncbi:hypothetical protein PLICRDRAFT_90616 [Plicaturopsis crispa FD-325 SS-3]|nr:hypothetical protein PLICRDRAFT_90616 [Plicaturopsis crispa FD-325 SS-3]
MPTEELVDFTFPNSVDECKISPFPLPLPIRQHPRRRALSHISISSTTPAKLTLDVPKAPPASSALAQRANHYASGSFTPTGSASECLASLVPSALSQRHERRRARLHWSTSSDSQSPSSEQDQDIPVTPVSPLSICSTLPSVPSISRTSSSFTASDIFTPDSATDSGDTSVPPSLRSFRRPRRQTLQHPHHRPKAASTGMHPILSAVERKSRLCAASTCATCKKSGFDFPRCGQCGDMWCSRECRLHGGVKRHVCVRQVV